MRRRTRCTVPGLGARENVAVAAPRSGSVGSRPGRPRASSEAASKGNGLSAQTHTLQGEEGAWPPASHCPDPVGDVSIQPFSWQQTIKFPGERLLCLGDEKFCGDFWPPARCASITITCVS